MMINQQNVVYVWNTLTKKLKQVVLLNVIIFFIYCVSKLGWKNAKIVPCVEQKLKHIQTELYV
jgi:hypothetical protein